MRRMVGAALVWLLLGGAAQAADCQLKQLSSIDITVMPNRLLVPVMFGEVRKDFAFHLEEGLSGVALETAQQLDFRIRSMPPELTVQRGGKEITRLAYAPKFKLGQISGTEMELLALPPGAIADGLDGTLGTGLFKELDFELDLARSKLNLFSPDHCPGAVVYWTKTGFAQLPLERDKAGHLTVAMELDGKPVRAALQTSGRSLTRMSVLKRLFGLDENSPGMVVVETRPSGTKLFRYPFKSLGGDGLSIANPTLTVIGDKDGPSCDGHMRAEDVATPGHPAFQVPELVTCYGGFDVQLGVSVLSKLHLYFSTKEKLVYLTGAGQR